MIFFFFLDGCLWRVIKSFEQHLHNKDGAWGYDLCLVCLADGNSSAS